MTLRLRFWLFMGFSLVWSVSGPKGDAHPWDGVVRSCPLQ